MASTFLQCVKCKHFIRFDPRPERLPDLNAFLCWQCEETDQKEQTKKAYELLGRFPDLGDLDID